MGKRILYVERPLIALAINQHNGEDELVRLIEPIEDFITRS
jgi:hypothetical protein